MGCIFKPEQLSWEDIDGGRGELIIEEIEAFVSDYCYQDEPADYGDDGELANELVFFSEAWEKLNGWDSYGKIADTFQTAAVLSLIDGAFHDSMAADRISEKLTKSATKPDLVKIITHVASLYCWYILVQRPPRPFLRRAELPQRVLRLRRRAPALQYEI